MYLSFTDPKIDPRWVVCATHWEPKQCSKNSSMGQGLVEEGVVRGGKGDKRGWKMRLTRMYYTVNEFDS